MSEGTAFTPLLNEGKQEVVVAGIFPVVLRPGRPVLPKCGEVVDHNPWTIQCAVSKGITVISFLKERDLSARSAALSMEDTCTSVNPKYSEKSKKFSSMLIMSVFPNLCILVKSVTFKNSRHFYLAVSKLEHKLKALVDAHSDWRKNAITFTNRYIEAGLRDRALTRDLEWGIKVPKEGYENKTIYIWAENVLGYLSASETAAREAGTDFSALWDKDAPDSIHYYVHGKDNIPFHTIILPSLLLAHGGGWRLPDRIVSSEYLTLEGRKISTSRNYAIWVKDLLERYEPDSIRYYFLANGPEKRDADFSWNDYVHSHNSELVGAYGNFVNRSLAFITKYFDSIVPPGANSAALDEQLKTLYVSVGKKIENCAFRDALREIFDFVRAANKFFDTRQPWITRTSNRKDCENTLFECVQIIANLAVLLFPFLPFSSEKVCRFLGLGQNPKWEKHSVSSGYLLPEIEILFQRIDKTVIEAETEKLKEIL